MDNRIAIGVISVFVVLAVIGSALTPMIDAYTTTTITIENEGAVGLRMDKVTSGDFTLTYGVVGDDFTATNGTDAQIIDDMCIFYADDNVAVWMDDSSVRMLGKDANDQIIDAALSDEATITITKSADGVNITDGTVDQTFPVPDWSYVPKSTGTYGFFLNETEINTAGLDVHYVGSFAGVNCYDSIISHDLPITLDATVTDSILTGAKWIKAGSAADPETELTPLEPGSLTPLDPEPDASIMAVPTPTYTDGDWGYDLLTTGYDTTVAKIVSYSGSGGDIVVPSSIGGYVVAEIGKGGSNEYIANNSDLSNRSSLTIPNTVNKINGNAFSSLYNITSYNLPDSIISIGQRAFNLVDCGGNLIIPDSVITISALAFNSSVKYGHDIIIPNSVMSMGGSVFSGCNCTNLIMDLNDDITLTTSTFGSMTVNPQHVLSIGKTVNDGDYGLTSSDIKDNVPALGYLASLQYEETVTEDGPVAALLQAIPLIAIIAVVMMAVGVFIAHRTE